MIGIVGGSCPASLAAPVHRLAPAVLSARSDAIAGRLRNVTLAYALKIAGQGWQAALRSDPHLAAGLNVHAGQVIHEAVARDLGYDHVAIRSVL